MKRYRRWLYLANDLTTMLLGQEPDRSRQRLSRLKTWLFVFVILFLLSLVFNIYYVING